MTRNRDLLPPSPLTCTHEHPIPIVDDETNEILFWKCECGRSFEAERFANKEEPTS
jgi:hypothetical protein